MPERLILRKLSMEEITAALQKQGRIVMHRPAPTAAEPPRRVSIQHVSLHKLHQWSKLQGAPHGPIRIRAELKPEKCSVCLGTVFHETEVDGVPKWVCDRCDTVF